MLPSNETLLTFIVNAAWQIPAILGLAVITTRLLRSGPASYRHLVWVVALIAAVIVPVLSATTHRDAASLASDVPAMTGFADSPSTTSSVRAQKSRVTPVPSPRSVNLS